MLEGLLLVGALTASAASNVAAVPVEIHDRAESARAVGASLRLHPLAGRFELREGLTDGNWTAADEKRGERWTSRHEFELAYDAALHRLSLRATTGGREVLAAERALAGRLSLEGPNLLRVEVANFDANASVRLEGLELVQGDLVRPVRGFGRGAMTQDLATIWEPALAGGFRLRGTVRVEGAVRPSEARVWIDFGLGAGRRIEAVVEGYGWVRSQPERLVAAPGAKSAVAFFGRDERVRLEASEDPALELPFRGWSANGSEPTLPAIELAGGAAAETWTAHFDDAPDAARQPEGPRAIEGGGNFVFTNTSPITLPAGAPGTTSGPADPYPSTIFVGGPIGGAITDVNVVLDGVTHTFPDDLDVLVVSPIGSAVLIMSDACGGDDVADFFWRFDDQAPAPMTDDTPDGCFPFNVQPTNYGAGDTFPAPAPGTSSATLAAFNDGNPNGTWSLFIVDDAGGDVGDIDTGWAVEIATEPYQILIPGSGTSGPGDPYPSARNVIETSSLFGTVLDADATLVDMTHTFMDDVDVLLVGPGGAASILMSDACGSEDILNYIWIFSDEAPAPLSDSDIAGCNPFDVQPTDYEPGDTWPAPAPGGTFSANLAVFDGGPAIGTWNLYVNDDVGGDAGFLETDWFVTLVTSGLFRDGFESGSTIEWSVTVP
jgi:subtilisin-like proprotein convertase family protein